MLISMRGHFVVALFELRNSLAMLSVLAERAKATVRLAVAGDSQPKATKAQREAESSADVDAHIGCSFFPLQTCIFSASQLFLPQTRVFFTSCIFPHRGCFFFALSFFHVSQKNVSVFQI